MRQRAAVLAPLHNTNRPYTLPEMGKQIASKAHRHGGAARCPEPTVPQSSAGALARLGHDAQRLRDGELSILTTATPPKAQPLYLRWTVPGVGASLRVLRLYAIHEIARCPRVQAVLS